MFIKTNINETSQIHSLLQRLQSIAMQEEYQILNLVSMMDNVSLEEFSLSMLCDSFKKMMSDDIQTSSSSSQSSEIPLMKYPDHIQDHHKLAWMIKDNTLVETLMTKQFPILNQYLQIYFQNISRQQSPFSFVQVYPSLLSLKANRRYRAGQKIIQIGEQWCLGKREFEKAWICKYLRNLHQLIQDQINIFSSSDHCKDDFKDKVSSCLRFEDIIYVFQMKFIFDVLNISPKNQSELAECLFFNLLPKNFELQPFHHIETIKRYHQDIGVSLQNQKRYIITIYDLLRSFVEGDGLKKEFRFKHFLWAQNIKGIEIYEKYLKQLTFDNYLWATICEKTRIYHKTRVNRKNQNKEEPLQTFVPILDLFHNSYLRPNICWELNSATGTICIFASRQIECGHLLSTYYNYNTIEQHFNYYGIVDVGLECSFLLPYYYDANIVSSILQIHIRSKLKPGIKSLVQQVIQRTKEPYVLLSFDSYQFEKASIEQNLAQLTMRTLELLAQMAQTIYSSIWKPFAASRGCQNRHSKNHSCLSCTKVTFNLKSFRKDQDLMKKISRGIKQTIATGLQKKNDQIDQLRNDLKKCKDFKTEYNLMCLHTILYRERELLRKVNESIFNINKGEVMSIE